MQTWTGIQGSPAHWMRRCLGAAVLCAPALASAYTELEPNDTWAAAQAITNPAGDLVMDGTRSFANPSDDFFSFLVRGPGLLRIVATSGDAFADSVMGLYNSSGTLLASNDEGGAGFMSVIEYTVGAGQAGTFTLGFSGYNPGLLSCTDTVLQCYDTNGDFVFDTFVAGGGAGGSTGWDYRLTISGVALVPEPHAALLFAPALAALLWRRRATQRRPSSPA